MTRTARFLSVFLLASLGCACEKSQSSHASTVTANPVQAPALAPPVATTPAATDADTSTNAPTTATTPEVPMPTPTIAASPDLAFAFDLLGVMPGSAAGTNLVYSPTSIAAVLAMAELGAGGETAQQIADGLHRPVEHAAMLVSLQSLVSSWKGADKSNPLQVANAIYLHNELTLAPTYRKQITGDFAANVETVDFVGASEKARKQINTWVAKQTHQLIKELLMPGAVGADTVMVLVNAVYFKGKWAKPFNVKTSHNDVFHAAGQDVQVTMMSSHIPLRRAISTSGNYRLLEIPYATKGLSMLLLLPNESTTLAEVEKITGRRRKF